MKQPPHKCLAAWLLALVMALTMLPVGVLALEEVDDGAPAEEQELSLPDEEAPSISVEVTETVAPAVGSQSDAELLEGYLYAISGIRRGSTVYRVPPRPLTVELKDIEEELKDQIRKVAAGELASTQFSFTNEWTKTKAEWGIASDDPVISGVLRRHVCTLQSLLDHHGAHLGGGGVLQGAAKGTDGGAAAIDNIQVFHESYLL